MDTPHGYDYNYHYSAHTNLLSFLIMLRVVNSVWHGQVNNDVTVRGIDPVGDCYHDSTEDVLCSNWSRITDL